jgi:hypothetical protein
VAFIPHKRETLLIQQLLSMIAKAHISSFEGRNHSIPMLAPLFFGGHILCFYALNLSCEISTLLSSLLRNRTAEKIKITRSYGGNLAVEHIGKKA